MSIIEIVYYSGVGIAFIIGLISLVVSDEEDCNISNVFCVLTMVALSSLSWLMVIMQIGTAIQEKYFKETKQ